MNNKFVYKKWVWKFLIIVTVLSYEICANMPGTKSMQKEVINNSL